MCLFVLVFLMKVTFSLYNYKENKCSLKLTDFFEKQKNTSYNHLFFFIGIVHYFWIAGWKSSDIVVVV